MPTSRIEETKQISDLLATMFEVVDEQLADALNVIQGVNIGLADRVRRRDDEVDELEMRIDRKSEAILMSRPDDPRVVRFVMAAIKVNTDLERIGDHCKNIAKSADRIPNQVLVAHATHFDAMVFGVRTMLYAAQDALLGGDLGKAWQLIENGHAVGRLHTQTLDRVTTDSKTQRSFKAGARVYALSKALERIADHCVNIAESVLFWAEGIDVRHPRRGLLDEKEITTKGKDNDNERILQAT